MLYLPRFYLFILATVTKKQKSFWCKARSGVKVKLYSLSLSLQLFKQHNIPLKEETKLTLTHGDKLANSTER